MVAAEELVDPAELHEAELEDRLPRRLNGLPLASGIAIGRAVLHEPRVEVTRLIAEDLEEERRRLDEAVSAMRAAVDRMLHSPAFALGGEHREILEAYRMFANDHGWLMRMREAITSGLTAEAAVERVQVETRARLMRVTDPYLRERLHDLEDLANRLLRQLAGKVRTAAYEQLGEDAIVVARNMGPAELLDYDPAKLRGIVLEEGSATSHVAIVARALDLPLVGGLDGILEWIEPDDPLVVDGDSGDVYLRPSLDILQAYQEKIALRAQQQAQFAALRELPSVTRDGVAVDLAINAGLLLELPHLAESGACGIGLFRTELQFMISATFPRLAAQTALYRQVIEAAEPRPVVFRTLDIGGDKVLPYLTTMREQNPALGWRAIRIALDRPVLLRYQIRALLAATVARDLNVMFPLVAEVEEFIQARALVEREVERLRRFGRPLPRRIRVGTMLEVPALAWRINTLLPYTDFVSVGSNDLLQFFFACDRENPRLAGRYDLLSPSLLSLLHHVVRACQAHDVPVSICGEQAGRPLEAMALLGLGFRAISMPPAAVGPVKRMIRSLSVAEIESYIGGLLDLPDRSLRPQLEAFARTKGIFV
jgi:phosphotransferase system enzyme I (PtsP)